MAEDNGMTEQAPYSDRLFDSMPNSTSSAPFPQLCKKCGGYLVMPACWSGTILPRLCNCQHIDAETERTELLKEISRKLDRLLILSEPQKTCCQTLAVDKSGLVLDHYGAGTDTTQNSEKDLS